MGTGIAVFEREARRAGFALDEAQRRVAHRLAGLGAEVERRRRLLPGPPPRGVHLWGPVGRGKSWLAATFFDALAITGKRKLHFHEFFRRFHDAYARHRASPRAVDLAVDELLGGVRLLCFDEFHVHDPGDATLVARLLRSLFDRRVVLVTTSNHAPEGLLPNPLHHHLFEPVIALLTSALDVVELDGEVDYRSVPAARPRSRFELGRYLWPGTAAQLGTDAPPPGPPVALEVNGRTVPAAAVRDDVVWLGFRELCDAPTSTADYLALADRFTTWVVLDLPVLGPRSRDSAQRFANVVDVLCDRDVRLVLTGAAPLAEVLRDGELPIDVGRTVSRLALLSAEPPAVR